MLQLFAFRRGAAATVAKACLCYQYRAGQRQQLYTLFPSFRPERSPLSGLLLGLTRSPTARSLAAGLLPAWKNMARRSP